MNFYLFCAATTVTGGMLWSQDCSTLTYPAAVFIWASGLLLLCYGLVRDLYLLRTCPCKGDGEGEKQKVSMLCVESTIGLLVVGQGLALQWLGWTPLATISLGSVLVVAGLILAFGHKTRDWVLILAVAPEHHNLLPTWKVSSLDEIPVGRS